MSSNPYDILHVYLIDALTIAKWLPHKPPVKFPSDEFINRRKDKEIPPHTPLSNHPSLSSHPPPIPLPDTGSHEEL